MAQYRKRPVVIEATRWWRNGDHPEDRVGEWLDDYATASGRYQRLEGAVVRYFRRPEAAYASAVIHATCDHPWHDHGWIDTLEGGYTVCPGDWIITGIAGERYPCKPGIFDATYEPVE